MNRVFASGQEVAFTHLRGRNHSPELDEVVNRRVRPTRAAL